MNSVIEQIEKYKIVPVVKLDREEDAIPLAQALIAGGLPLAEVTFRTEAAEGSIAKIRQRFPEMLVGAGTIVNVEQAKRAVAAGASFLVCPGLSEEVVRWAEEEHVPVLPGVMTPSEVMRALSWGLTALKLFPAGQIGGVGAVKALAGPFPQVHFMPTGGVSAENIREYLSNPQVIACGGSWMVKDSLIRGGAFDQIERITREAVAAAGV